MTSIVVKMPKLTALQLIGWTEGAFTSWLIVHDGLTAIALDGWFLKCLANEKTDRPRMRVSRL